LEDVILPVSASASIDPPVPKPQKRKRADKSVTVLVDEGSDDEVS